jgi:hypothetical protein
VRCSRLRKAVVQKGDAGAPSHLQSYRVARWTFLKKKEI